MGFWWGLFIGAVAGVNIGIVFGCLLAASKRGETTEELLQDPDLHMDQAVMDEVVADDILPGRVSRKRGVIANDAPAPHF